MSNNPDPVYSGHVVEFAAVASEYCKYAEHSAELKGDEILKIMQRLMPLLYLKASFLPVLEPLFEDGNEKFVTESDWYRIHDSFASRLGNANDYIDIPDQEFAGDIELVRSSIAEDLSDIYQDLKNFTLLYQTGTSEVMNDAIWECKMNFEDYWGIKLLNSLRQIHRFISSGSEIEEMSKKPEGSASEDHPGWFISKRQKEFRGEDE
jgi:hypothetical protein